MCRCNISAGPPQFRPRHQRLREIISRPYMVENGKRGFDMICRSCRLLDRQTLADQPMRHAFEMNITGCSGEVEDFIDEWSGLGTITQRQITLCEPQSGEQAQMGQARALKPSDDIAQLYDPCLNLSRFDQPVTADHSRRGKIERNGRERERVIAVSKASFSVALLYIGASGAP